MSNLREGAEDYLTLRRGLGFKLKRHGRFVRSFVESLEERGRNGSQLSSHSNGRRSLNIFNLRSGLPV